MKLSCLPVSYFGAIIQGKMSIQSWIKEAAELDVGGMDLAFSSSETEAGPGWRKSGG